MSPTPPIIALLTDFGDQDWYVASMRAVILNRCPQAQLVDITHKIEPGNARSASFVLSQCYDDFPRGTIFLCVVDPGVGSARKPIVHWDGDYHFVAPDNGLLSLLKPGMCRVWEIDPNRLDPHLKSSNTFHGRDIFAPAAALLASGQPPSDFCQALPQFAQGGSAFAKVERLPQSGSIIYFDHFGNGISNLQLDFTSPIPNEVSLADGTKIPFKESFSDVAAGKPVAYLGSGGLVEIAVNLGSARVSLALEDQSDFELS